MENLQKYLTSMNACPEAVEWVGDKNLKTAWAECERGDWMLWLMGRVCKDERIVVLAAAKTANLVRHLMKDPRSRSALDKALEYGGGFDAAASAHAAASAYAVYAAASASADAYSARRLILKESADICREVCDISKESQI